MSPLDDMYASFMDPDTGEKYTDPAKMKKDLGTSTVNGIRELVGHLVHANGMTPATAVDIAKQLVNSDLDTPGPTDDQSDYPGRRDREPQEFFKVAPKPDKAGNPIIKVPGYAPFKISPEMSSSVLDMQKSIREHSAKVRGWATSRSALDESQRRRPVRHGERGRRRISAGRQEHLVPDQAGDHQRARDPEREQGQEVRAGRRVQIRARQARRDRPRDQETLP